MPLDAAGRARDRYTAAEVCEAADITTPTLKNWVSREPQVIEMSDDDRERAASGSPIWFTFHRAMQVALTAEIVRMDLGIPPRRAAEIARTFSDTGTRGPGPAREAAKLFASGSTALIACPETGATKIVNITGRTSVMDIFGAVGSTKALVILVDPTFRRMREVLGIAP
jgi:hypothetical protein